MSGNDGIDPLANRFDLGDDPLAFYRKRLQLSRELWQRVQERGARPGDDPLRQRRVLLGGFRQLGRAADLVGKYVGGMYTARDLPGTTNAARLHAGRTGASSATPCSSSPTGIFSADSFRFKPEFLASAGARLQRMEPRRAGQHSGGGAARADTALDRLITPAPRAPARSAALCAGERAAST